VAQGVGRAYPRRVELGLEQRRRLTLAATIIGSSLAFIDATVVIVALPTIEQDLGLGLSGQQWVFLSYSLALASLYLAGGAIGDRYGRRRTFIAGAAGFALASLLAGAAPNEAVLLLARLLQGVAGAFLTTNSLALIRATYGDQAGRAIGLWTAWTSVATIAGPPAGGALVEWVSWRWIFLINLPLAALAVLAAHYGKCDETAQQRLGRLDVPGAVLAALGFGSLTYGLVEGADRGFPEVWWAFAVGVVALAAFVVAERRSSQPMLPFELFRRRNFAAANLETFLVYAALYGVFLYLTLYVQFLGFTPFEAGLIQIPSSLVMILLAARFGAIADRTGPRLLLTVGPALVGVGALMFLLVTDRDDFWIWGIGGLLVFSFGLAMLVAPITSTALKSAPSEFAGIASAVNNSVSRIGSLCSVAIIGLVVQRVFERNDGTGTPLEPTSTAVDHAANVDAFRAGMLVAAVLAFAGAIVGAAWISNREARASDEPVSEPAPVPAGGS
jgi:EmrB/QacA subfamily drug resistance transporter